jgi:AraC-like DNA-binding protein
MRQLKTGEFFGKTDQILKLNGLTLTDTVYTHPYVDWHYHEHAYFTFILQGAVLEGNKQDVFNCSSGSLLYHHHQEPHYNIKPDLYTRGFHVELEAEWFHRFDLSSPEGTLHIANPEVKIILYQLFSEMKLNDKFSDLSIQSLLLKSFENKSGKIEWIPRLKEILHDEENITLDYLSKELGLHPVHISRMFPKYFHCTISEYLRKVKVTNAARLLPNTSLSLTEIALSCGFSDQSHFNRCFKSTFGVVPSAYRQLFTC